LGSLDDAIEVYKEVVIHDDVKKKTIVLNGWNQLGNCYIRKKSYEEALKCYLKAENYFKLNKIRMDDEVVAKIYLNIGKLLVKR